MRVSRGLQHIALSILLIIIFTASLIAYVGLISPGLLVKASLTLIFFLFIFLMPFLNRFLGLVTLIAISPFIKLLMTMEMVFNSFLMIGFWLACWRLFLRAPGLKNISGLVPFLLLLGLMLLHSISSSDYVEVTYTLIQTFAIFLVIFYIDFKYEEAQKENYLIYICLSWAVFCIFALATFLGSDAQRLGEHLMMNANNIAFFSCFGLFFSVYCMLSGKISPAIAYPLLAIFLISLLSTGSRTFLVAGLIGNAYLLVLRASFVVGISAVICILVVSLLLFLGDIGEVIQGRMLKGIDEDGVDFQVASGLRFLILVEGLSVASANPLGVGVGEFTTVVKVASVAAEKDAMAAHNMYLNTLVELGVLGLFLLLIWNLRLAHFYFKHGLILLFLTSIMIFFVGAVSGVYFDIEYALIWAAAALATSTSNKHKFSSTGHAV